MRLYDEIFKDVEGMSTARYTVVPNGGGYFEGVKAVGDFSPQSVVVYFPNSSVIAEGENLRIKKYYDGDLQIAGRIFCVRSELHGSENVPKKGGK
ncbi:MAG: YabP/YqfC family sporulation protein [Clostridia bacterium]|nr:YabP/YqfC family sporulation protein [Clostridia bacterium]